MIPVQLQRPLRAVRLCGWVLYGMVMASALPLLKRRHREAIIRHWAGRILKVLNVHVHLVGDLSQGGMVVANHVSWLDIIVFHAMTPARFVAKEEVRRWPVFGRLASSAGTLFVQRQRRADSARLVGELQQLLDAGERVILFPEGTTTDGQSVSAFKSALLEAAVQSGCAVLPVALRYQRRDGSLDPTPAFTGDCTLLASLWRVLAARELHVSIWCGTAYHSAANGRREVAHIAHDFIGQALRKPPREKHVIVTPLSL